MCSILSSPLVSRPSTGATRGTDSLRRTARPHQLLVPRWGLARGRPGRAGRRAGADRAGRHRPWRAVRRGPLRRGGRGRRPASGHRAGDRAAGPGRRGSGRDRRCAAPRAGDGPAGRRMPGRSSPIPWSRGRARRGHGRSGSGCPVIASRSRRICEGSASAAAGRISCCSPGPRSGWRSLCRLISRANMAGTKAVPRFSQALLAEHTEGLVALSGCRDGELARRLRVGDRSGARAVAERYATLFGRGEAAVVQRLLHRALPPPARRRRLARGRDRWPSRTTSGCRSS